METPQHEMVQDNSQPLNKSERALLEAKMALKDFRAVYHSEDLIFKRIFDTMRLKAGDMCVCQTPISKYYEKKARFKYRCKICRRNISPLVDTPLKGIKVPLTTVFEIVYLTFLGKHGLTAAEVSRYHNLNYSTALTLKHRIGTWFGLTIHAFKYENTTVQVDETYVKVPTGLGRGIKYNAGLGSQRLKPVVSLVEDGGHERAKAIVVNHVNEQTMKKIFADNVDPSATVFTDGNPIYHFLSNKGYLHFECNHSQKIYSKEGINVNSCEALNGLLKSKLYHIHRGVSEQHLQQYCDEITWTFMNRSKNVFDAINTLFDALPPLNSHVTIKPNKEFKK